MTDTPDTYGSLHAGDLVLGDDGEVWGVARIVHVPQLAVTLVRPGHAATGSPPVELPVTVIERADVSAEWWAFRALSEGLGGVEILGEAWTE